MYTLFILLLAPLHYVYSRSRQNYFQRFKQKATTLAARLAEGFDLDGFEMRADLRVDS